MIGLSQPQSISLLQYFKQHWHGQLPFSVALLLNYILPLGLLSFALPILVESIFALKASRRIWVALILTTVFAVTFLWQCTGLLRSGDVKTQETGERLWSTGVQILLVLSVLFVIVLGIGVFQQVTALEDAAERQEFKFSRNYQFSIDQGDFTVRISGLLDPGVTRELDTLLSNKPEIKTIELESDGGQIYEGRGLYQLIKRRGLDTLVNQRCLSACTMAFLGGANRRIGTTGEIGFHQYRTYSIQPNINVSEEQSKDIEIMLSQGVSDSFVKKVFSATPDEMWVPDHAELLSAGVITEHLR